MTSSFAAALRYTLACSGMSQYGLSKRSGVDAPTINKWMHDRRRPTEAQVLQTFVGLACDGETRERVEVVLDDELSMSSLDRFLVKSGLSAREVSDVSNIGIERLGDILADASMATRAEKLRILIAMLCSREQVLLANRLLQAAGFYVMRAPDERTQPRSA